MSNVFAVIMAGGVGSRFWPKSREKTPKQLLQIFSEQTMIQSTVQRIMPLISEERIFIVTNRKQKNEIIRQIPSIPLNNILIEPVGRSTAPCIGLAAQWIHRIDSKGLMVVLPADHLITNNDEFLRIIKISLEIAEETEALGTIGIKPTYPETGFGYIQVDEKKVENTYKEYPEVFKVKTFAEKPNLETAQSFIQTGEFYWNSGMFVWKVGSILNELAIHLPEVADNLERIRLSIGTSKYEQTLETVFGQIRSISIDYGVMEKTKEVFMVAGNFGWSDVGSWDEVARLTEKNDIQSSFKGAVFIKNSFRNYVDAGNKLVALVGAEDLIVITTDDAVLICKKGSSQDVKEVVDYLRRKQMNEYL
jgi:mannose-1-phosphate guanylyltransferase